jgi:hypothetical protein
VVALVVEIDVTRHVLLKISKVEHKHLATIVLQVVVHGQGRTGLKLEVCDWFKRSMFWITNHDLLELIELFIYGYPHHLLFGSVGTNEFPVYSCVVILITVGYWKWLVTIFPLAYII